MKFISDGSSQTNSASNGRQWELRFHVEVNSKDLLLYYSIRMDHHSILSPLLPHMACENFTSTRFSHCSIISSGPRPC